MVEYIKAAFLEILGRLPDEDELEYTYKLSTSERNTWLYNRVNTPLKIERDSTLVERDLLEPIVDGLVLEN